MDEIEHVTPAELYSARQTGELLGMEHLEVIRRIRRGDIQASKVGWFWTVKGREILRVRTKPWYKKYQLTHND